MNFKIIPKEEVFQSLMNGNLVALIICGDGYMQNMIDLGNKTIDEVRKYLEKTDDYDCFIQINEKEEVKDEN